MMEQSSVALSNNTRTFVPSRAWIHCHEDPCELVSQVNQFFPPILAKPSPLF